MRYLSKYKLFESKEMSVEELRSAIFRFYTPIPLSRKVASKVIKLLFNYNNINFPSILTDSSVNLELFGKKGTNYRHSCLKNKLRFEDYLNSLLGETDDSGDKANRGFDFEGLIAGFFDGEISTDPKSKYDVTIGDDKHSVKFLNGPGENPTLTTITSIYDLDSVKKLNNYEELKERGLFDIFSVGDNVQEMSKDIRKVLKIGFGNVDYFTVGYPKMDTNQIVIKVIKTKRLIDAIMDYGYKLRVPNNSKSDKKWDTALNGSRKSNKHEIRINNKIYSDSSKYVDNVFIIDIPQTTDEEIREIYYGQNREWADEVFGPEWSNKMRTDVINHIRKHKDKIITNMSDFDNI